jgi:hypothetical protein
MKGRRGHGRNPLGALLVPLVAQMCLSSHDIAKQAGCHGSREPWRPANVNSQHVDTVSGGCLWTRP